MQLRRLALIVAMIAIAAALSVYFLLQPSDSVGLQRARRALAARNYAQAEQLAILVARRSKSDPQAWIIAGEAAAGSMRWDVSLQYFERVQQGTIEQLSAAAYGRGEACVQLARYECAEREFKSAFEVNPAADLARRRLADLLIFTNRPYRAAPLLRQLIGSSQASLDDLFHLGDLDHPVSRSPAVYAAAEQPQADPSFIMGAALQSVMDGHPQAAKSLFERVLKQSPTDPDALAGLGETLLLVAPADIANWSSRLTPSARQHAGVLAILGQIAELAGQPTLASKLYASVVIQRPTSRLAWHRLGIVLRRTGRISEAEMVLDRARQLTDLGIWLNDLFGNRGHLGLLRRVAEQLSKLGRNAEARAWTQHALTVAPREAWALRLLARLDQQAPAIVDAKTEQSLRALLEELTAQFIPASSDEPIILTSEQASSENSPIRFADTAQRTGLNFIFHAARDPETTGSRIIETTGGGVAAIDYDNDGWPDLYFTQGSRRFPIPDKNPDHDQLFRNQLGQSWQNISDKAGTADVQFGQGVAAGDWNNDGFTDLYAANYGVNVLYENLGDGTFRDVTPPIMSLQKAWTSSCVIVDLNGDGQPDLFDVTYCGGPDVETRMCDKQGVQRACSPRVFTAEVDRLWLNSGDGTWSHTHDDGLDLPNGLGLGVLAFRTSIDTPLGLFVANDEEPNFWLTNSARAGDKPRWQDRARGGGLAVDADGQAQACMGVGCDDANGDGLPDLFVTNFYHESNTLYSAISDHLYEDQTRSVGLRQPSWNMLGFGTQFIDADLDGWPDLLVANGHVDDLTPLGTPYEMPLQCFQNQGGVFQELPAKVAGECFTRTALGRGMARLDWDGDGREDAVIVNQESSATMLTNRSTSTGSSLRLQFRATVGARDAIGTIVRVHLGPRLLTRQLTAGDGYQASNERQLVIGLGKATAIDKVEVFWPDGTMQELQSLLSSKQYIVIQGQGTAVQLR